MAQRGLQAFFHIALEDAMAIVERIDRPGTVLIGFVQGTDDFLFSFVRRVGTAFHGSSGQGCLG
jgi:hypothetical protein